MYIKVTAASKGKKSGLFSYGDDKRNINILVIPKVWRTIWENQTPFLKLSGKDPRYYHHMMSDDTITQNIIMHETDIVYLKIDSREWRRLLRGLAENDQYIEDYKDLISFEVKKPTNKKITPLSLPFANNNVVFNQMLQTVILLALLFKDHTQEDTSSPDSDIDDIGRFIGNNDISFENLDPFLLLTQYEFVREMKKLQDELRQGYLSTIERTSAIKGRITTQGILEHMAFGIPSLECEYDTFTTGLPIYKLLATTLELVANGGVLSALNLEYLQHIFADTQNSAGQIRHYLGHIPSMPLEQAIYAATNFRVPYQHRQFRKAVALAKKILCMPSSVLENSQENNGLYWILNTDKIWERCVEQITDAKHVQVTVRTWENISSKDKDIDVIFEVPTLGWIVGDAKYKPVPSTPESGDQHQIFVYSLAYTEKTPFASTLIYPGNDDTLNIRSFARVRTNLESTPSTPFQLHIVTLPFPMPDTLAQWNDKVVGYRTTLFEKLRNLKDNTQSTNTARTGEASEP